MEIKSERAGGTLISRPAGKIEGTNANEFHQALLKSIEPDVKRVILNLRDISYISSSGLRVIAMTNNHAIENHIQFCICSPITPVENVLATCGLNRMIPVHSTEQEAINVTGAQ